MNIVTWNMQGATGFGESKWRTDVSRLFHPDFGTEVACLQEAGYPPDSAVLYPAPPWLPGFAAPVGSNWLSLTWNLGTQSRPFNVFIFWFESDPGAHRNNLAIASIIGPLNLIYVGPGILGGRPAIGLRVPYGVGGADIFTLHAFSGGGGDAPGLLGNINATGGSWFAAGDYNRDPSTWVPAGAGVPPAGAVPCNHNPVPTHPGSGTNLDYAFKDPGPAVYGAVNVNFVVSDHFLVQYQL